MTQDTRVTLRTGGQSGVDRASLDLALELGIPYQGWCPQGGWAEDLPEPPGLLALYPHLQETSPDNPAVQDAVRRHRVLQGLPCTDPAIRTVMNVEASDALLTLTRQSALSGGTNLAVETARAMGLPELTVLLDDPQQAAQDLRRFLAGLPPGVVIDLNGPRASEAPGIYQQVQELLGAALSELQELPHTHLDALELDLVTHLGADDEPYLTGVYLPDDYQRDFCFAQQGSSRLDEARRAHQAMLAAWSEPRWGACACGEAGWIVDEQEYCRTMVSEDHQPQVCAECLPEDPCATHRYSEG